MKFAVDFVEKLSSPSVGAGYPIQISARDLMQNFSKAALIVSTNGPQPFTESEKTVNHGVVRELLLDPAPPTGNGTYVFGFKDGKFTWLSTEEC